MEGQATLKRLRRDMPGSGQYLDEVMERIGHASRQFDGSGDELVTKTWKLYADGTPLLGLWVALNDAGQIIGHAVGDVQIWSGRTVAWITQVVMDETAPLSLKQQFMNAVDGWVVEVNQWALHKNPQHTIFNEIIIMSPRMTNAWARKAGFEEYRRVYRRFVRPAK
jgi:hypothetical protein